MSEINKCRECGQAIIPGASTCFECSENINWQQRTIAAEQKLADALRHEIPKWTFSLDAPTESDPFATIPLTITDVGYADKLIRFHSTESEQLRAKLSEVQIECQSWAELYKKENGYNNELRAKLSEAEKELFREKQKLEIIDKSRELAEQKLSEAEDLANDWKACADAYHNRIETDCIKIHALEQRVRELEAVITSYKSNPYNHGLGCKYRNTYPISGQFSECDCSVSQLDALKSKLQAEGKIKK